MYYNISVMIFRNNSNSFRGKSVCTIVYGFSTKYWINSNWIKLNFTELSTATSFCPFCLISYIMYVSFTNAEISRVVLDEYKNEKYALIYIHSVNVSRALHGGCNSSFQLHNKTMWIALSLSLSSFRFCFINLHLGSAYFYLFCHSVWFVLVVFFLKFSLVCNNKANTRESTTSRKYDTKGKEKVKFNMQQFEFIRQPHILLLKVPRIQSIQADRFCAQNKN